MVKAPYQQIVITNLEGKGPMASSMVVKIPPTCSEHNVMVELLKRIRTDYPGAWYCVEQWIRDTYRPTSHTTSPKLDMISNDVIETAAKVKIVTREHLGLPPDDDLNDLPM